MRKVSLRQWTTSIFAAIATLAVAAPAEAANMPFAPSTLFANFNVITDGNFATGSDVHGPVLIGGNLSNAGAGILDFLNLPQSCCTTPVPNYGLIDVFGNNSGHWSQSSGQTVFIGGTNTGGFGSATITTGYTFPGFNSIGAGSNSATFANEIWAPLTSMSTNLAGLTHNSTFNATTGVLTGVAGPNGAVFDIPLSTLNAFRGTLSLAGCLAAATPCDGVVNVTGTFAQDFAFPTADNIPGLPNLLFNFVSATGVEWGEGGDFDASILAPDAVGSNNGSDPLVGTLVVDSVSSTQLGDEIHNAAFDCSDNLCMCPPGSPGCTSGPPPSVPEPGSLALLGSGLAAFAAVPAGAERCSPPATAASRSAFLQPPSTAPDHPPQSDVCDRKDRGDAVGLVLA
jgi:hypothetical protein